jgi:formylglycine-generating enzyme required for sulfatase activity
MKKAILIMIITMMIIAIIFSACDPKPVEYTLTINATNGTVSVKVGGDNLTGSSPYTIEEGSSVSLTANPDDGYSFDDWSGDLTGSDNPVTFTMNSDVTVTANFVEDVPTQYTLTIGISNDSDGTGTINPLAGTYNYNYNTSVTVTASPNTNMYFNGWYDSQTGGVVVSSNLSYTFNITEDTELYAYFTNVPTYNLTINYGGNGSGNVSLNPQPPYYQGDDTIVTLTISPDTGSSFSGWTDSTGLTTVTPNVEYTVMMNQDRTYEANFTINQYTLSTNVVGNGSITLDPTGGTYDYGTVVTVEATPDTGWSFDSWSGDLTGSTNPTTITMDGDKSITATFTINQYTLTTNVTGNGSITLDPTGGTYDYGTVVTVEAVADSGWSFDSWSGDLTGSTNPTTITMDGDKSITATFTINQYTLTTNVVGNGSITLDPTGGTYDYGTVVTVEAVPVSYFDSFDSWTGDLTGSTNPATITMDSNKSITGNFVSVSYRDMVSVPSGTFTQEDTVGNSFTHSLSAFEIGKYEVTYELWYAVRTWGESNGYSFSNLGREGHDGTAGATPTSGSKYEPVTFINWRDSMVWCNAYSEMDGRTPVYYSDSSYTTVLKVSSDSGPVDSSPGSYDNPYVDDTANGYRLPTEGQWQYAASYIDGTSWLPTNYASGATDDYNNASATGAVAWYNANSGSSTHDVGTKLANDLGIYDMSGNVWEWCWDWYGSYPSGPETDYEGAVSGSGRVARGGSWGINASYLLVGSRIYDSPYDESGNFGFRVSFPSD